MLEVSPSTSVPAVTEAGCPGDGTALAASQVCPAAKNPAFLNACPVDAPEISVVMAVYNGAEHLEEAVQSILLQTYRNFEFIIVDDGSTDMTEEILESFDDSRIRTIRNSENLGLPKSLNKGIRAARGRYVARMDADDISLSHRFERQMDFLERNSGYSLLGSSYYQIDRAGKVVSLVRVLTGDAEIRSNLKKQNWFGHGSVMMQKQAWSWCGGYDEEFRFAEDYDLWLRIAECSMVANIGEPLYCWRQNPNAMTSKVRQDEQKYYIGLAVNKAEARE